MKIIVSTTVAIALTTVGCATASPAAHQAESPQQSAGTPSGTSPVWNEMNTEQRTEYMGLTVLPAMVSLFRQHNADAFSEMRCQTCHGDNMQEVKYAMPNASLMTLDAQDPITNARQYDAEMTEFMVSKVVPQMAQLLGQQAGVEFTCFNCHTSE